MPELHTASSDCIQGPTLSHIMASLDRLEAHGERTIKLLEVVADNSATIQSHAKKLEAHDTAFTEIFRWRREFTDKQEEDFRGNLAKIHALEEATAVAAAVEATKDEVEERLERKSFKAVVGGFFQHPFAPIIIGMVLYLLDKYHMFSVMAEVWKGGK